MMNEEIKWHENVGFEIEVIKDALCRANHKVGQKFDIKDYLTPKGLCMEAFHDMYPLIFAGRIDADFTVLGSKDKNERVYTCPSRDIQFKITRFYQCNNCGYKTEKEDLKQTQRNYGHVTLDVLVCPSCHEELVH